MVTGSVELSARAEPWEGDGVRQVSSHRTIPGAFSAAKYCILHHRTVGKLYLAGLLDYRRTDWMWTREAKMTIRLEADMIEH